MSGTTTEPQTNAKDVSVLLFGSQVESFNKEFLGKTKRTLLDGPSREWVLKTVAELPSYWDALAKAIPKIIDSANTGKQLVTDLGAWLRQDLDEENQLLSVDNVSSVILSPLVVLIQLTQYRQYLELHRGAATDPHAELVASKKTSTLGFCMGLLGAFAVASASNMEELDKYGAVAVRLAMVGGALIDAQDKWSKESGLGISKSYATAWRNDKQKDDMLKIVNGLFPEAYVSVLYDEARATITTSERAAPRLLRQLRSAGLTSVLVHFPGDIHSPKPETRVIVDALIAFCNSESDLQLPDAHQLALPSYTNAGDGKPIAPGAGFMHDIALRTVFAEQCDWYGTFAAVKASQIDRDEGSVVTFGPDRCVPPTFMRHVESKLVHFADLDHDALEPSTSGIETEKRLQQEQEHPLPLPEQKRIAIDNANSAPVEDAIAVIGMSIKVAGADDLDEFSGMLRTGKSQHQVIPPDRMDFESLYRENEKEPRQWYANLMRDIDTFDHKFFKRSPRESAAMDPQQRLFLQAAYQAVEQSGYFTEDIRSSRRDKNRGHVGVYIGAPAVDYEHNVACHAPSAFTATGNLQSFLSGRVAHHFGWTGPAMTLDTACSSSAVAIHTACRNLLAGECYGALAGGVSLFTNPLWFQNLDAANFLSPTGQCKPFDAQADGFCRAESISCVFLKRMSDAVADGNLILGSIASSAVYQNQNITPMFVPNSPSLSQLFKDVVEKAGMTPGDISLVEAHGTGTPVGDPAEYEGIRQALAGSGVRSKPLPLGSVKGHVGHTEGASGVVSLIKVLMMMLENYIPPQASFSRLSPGINASPSDMIEVVTRLRPWSDGHDNEHRKVALINNYGAGGSNAAMVVAESPSQSSSLVSASIRTNEQQSRYPFWISGHDERSIKTYAAKLISSVELHVKKKSQVPLTLADISFNINRHSNPALSHGLIFSCSSLSEFSDKVSQVASPAIEPIKPERPVILCFGGQVSTFVGLDRKLYDSISVFRQHLDECDTLIQSMELGSIYPDIFSRTPISDPVRLQTMLLAIQYASARSWIDCGLAGKVTAVVGHSFGELTALCISGVLSLKDTILLVARRSELVRDAWGPDKGAMIALEADESVVERILVEAASSLHGQSVAPASIACYNGPRNFTLAGSSKAIDAVVETIAKSGEFSSVKKKVLNVTNAFHSSLVDPLLGGLEDVGSDLTFHEPSITLERATKTRFTGHLTSQFVSEHMRQPVFFSHAIQRLAKENPSAIFLEAGSSSTIAVMASRALAGQAGAGNAHYFQSINITNDNGLDGLTDATTSLWKQGVRVSFWAHHAQQTNEYESLLLPPYQFEKTRHWLERKSPSEAVSKAAAHLVEQGQAQYSPQVEIQELDETNLGLWSFIGYQDTKGKTSKEGQSTLPRFRINTGSKKYNKAISGHVIAQTAPICPGTLQIDMAIEALFSLHPDWKDDELQPVIHNMTNYAPLCVDPSRVVLLEFVPLDLGHTKWEWTIFSASVASGTKIAVNDSKANVHVRGELHVRSPVDASYLAEFTRFERLVSYAQCAALLAAAGRDGDGVDAEVLQGRQVYRAFSEYVDYAEMYRGVRTVVSRGDECAGRVCRQYTGDTWLDVPLDDCFSQVSGLWVNCMTNVAPGDMYIANGVEMTMRSPRGVLNASNTQSIWHVYARHTRQSDTSYVTDVFVFDASSGKLAEIILGIQYTQVSKATMSRMLIKLTKDNSVLKNTEASAISRGEPAEKAFPSAPVASASHQHVGTSKSSTGSKKELKQEMKVKSPAKRPDITDEVRGLVATVAGMDLAEILSDTELADIGIDSLMGMELGREVETAFKCAVDQTQLLQATNVRQLVEIISSVLGANQDFTAGPVAVETHDREDREDITDVVRQLVATVAGMDIAEVTLDAELADIGIDSLMGMELGREIETSLKCTVDQTELLQVTNVRQLVEFLSSVLYGASKVVFVQEDSYQSSSDQEEWSSSSAALTPGTGMTTPSTKKEGVKFFTPGDLQLSRDDILECFGDVKMSTDRQICNLNLDNIDRVIISRTSRLSAALIVEAFEELGCSLRNAAPGDILERVKYLPQYERLMEWMYSFLETDTRLINIDRATGQLTRTAIAVPSRSSETIRDELLEANPDWAVASKLIYHAGKPLASILSGETDGIRVLFGSSEGRDLVAALYRDHPFNIMLAGQMCDLINRLMDRAQGGTLKILEMGAGTGGTTVILAPFLASLNIPVEYTFTDLSSSMVAAARRNFGKKYPFMRFAVHDIGKPPAEELCGQHIIVASNAVHATHNLVTSATNIRKAMRPDGFIMLLEQTECMPFSNLIFGLLEGWWLFDDGRTHAIVSTERWERDLQTAGFGHVDWTDGQLPENNIQRVIVALASGPAQQRLPIPQSRPEQDTKQSTRDVVTREADAERYVAQYTANWASHASLNSETTSQVTNTHDAVVVVTGATGSLGSHLVAAFAENPDVKAVVCVNRRNSRTPVEERQANAFSKRGISLSSDACSKLRIFETDASQERLGLSTSDYEWLVQHGTHIVHNAWPMSGTRPIVAFESQFQTMRNLLDLARDQACRSTSGEVSRAPCRIGFQLVTSIGIVGHSGQSRAVETRVPISSVLPTGYCEGKWVCERMLDETLHQYPNLFRPMVARPGQIAGSSSSGVWNTMEHFAFLVKSAQTLRSWPDFNGTMQWIPVDVAANVMADLLYIGNEIDAPEASAVYHIDNPVGQAWKEMSPVLAEALGIPADCIEPFRDWLRRVCRAPLSETENPAARIIDFLDRDFERMSCGGVILGTDKTKEHSQTMAAMGTVSHDVVRKYVKAWKQAGFLV